MEGNWKMMTIHNKILCLLGRVVGGQYCEYYAVERSIPIEKEKEVRSKLQEGIIDEHYVKKILTRKLRHN